MIHIACQHAINILESYYQFSQVPLLNAFIMMPSGGHFTTSQVLVYETTSEVHLGIQFEKNIFHDIENLLCKTGSNNKYISINTAAIISEEVSHFLMLFEAAQNSKKISILNLEILGEIDRFLCLMHWNETSSHLKMRESWKNIQNLCDAIFQGDRFKSHQNELYAQAEHFAFEHLKKAFYREWDQTYFDFSKISTSASKYLKDLRKNFFYS